MSIILKALPSSLKTHLAKFMYQDAILVHKFFQRRDDNFYSKHLEDLQVDKYNQGDLIAKQGSQVEFVFFIMSGVVMNEKTERYIEAGHIINHDSLLLKKSCSADFTA